MNNIILQFEDEDDAYKVFNKLSNYKSIDFKENNYLHSMKIDVSNRTTQTIKIKKGTKELDTLRL
jgi:hypothetical protein